MAVVIEAVASALPLAGTFKSITNDEAQKRTLLDGASTDTQITNLVDDLDNLSNAKLLNWKFGGRAITGMKGSASASSQNLVSAFAVLEFSQANPVNVDLPDLKRSFSIPAYVEAIRSSDNSIAIAAAGTGSAAARIGRMVAYLVDHLCAVDAAGATVVGGWTYNGGGFGTGADFVDGS